MVKTLDLYGLYWTTALYGLIFTRTLQHKTLLKNQPRHQRQLRFNSLDSLA